MKIITVNRHISQPINDETPRVDIIPDSAILHSGKPFFVPAFSSKWRYEITIAVRSTRLGKNIAAKFAHRYYDAIALAARTIPCDATPSASAINHAFDGAFILGDWVMINPDNSIDEITIDIDGKTSTIKIPQLEIDNTIAWLSSYFTLKIGDIITPATLSLCGDITIGSTINCNIKNISGSSLKLKFK